jgi:hypothetical protein
LLQLAVVARDGGGSYDSVSGCVAASKILLFNDNHTMKKRTTILTF